jgi:hypothetical protein
LTLYLNRLIRFQLYVSPINIDPANPALPHLHPRVTKNNHPIEVGEFYTRIAEDTKALERRAGR